MLVLSWQFPHENGAHERKQIHYSDGGASYVWYLSHEIREQQLPGGGDDASRNREADLRLDLRLTMAELPKLTWW